MDMLLGAALGLLAGVVGMVLQVWRFRANVTAEVGVRTSALVSEQQRLDTVLQAMDDAVMALDAEGRVTLLNESARQLLERLGHTDPSGKALRDLGPTTVLADMVASMRDSKAVSAELTVDGPPARSYLARATRTRNADGFVVVLQDVTRLRKLEKMRKDFVANVSHELRTPVTIIRANAETLLNGAINDPAMASNFLSALLRNADRLSNLVSDLLDLSRIESGRLELDFQKLGARSLAAQAIDAISDHAKAKEQRLRLAIVEELCVHADPNALEQVLVNLLSNASKYTPEGGEITVTAHEKGHLCRFEVVDNGHGIATAHHRRVFERFYRVDKGRSRGVGGTGLGLAIVKHLVTAMGGTVGLQTAHPDDAERPGCRFWFTVPVSHPDVGAVG